MRIRTILAAAAAPAALAATLLGTTTAASAATTQPVTVTWHTHESGVADTTSLTAPVSPQTWQQLYPTVVVDPTYGPTWATDNLERTVTAVQDQANPQLWHVTVASNGSFAAFANPLTGAPFTGSGSVKGTIEYDVTAPVGVVPSPAGLHGPSSPTMRSSNLALAMFGPGATITGGGNHYQFDYTPIPGGGSGPNGLVYDQSA
jgi:hypothetical protein